MIVSSVLVLRDEGSLAALALQSLLDQRHAEQEILVMLGEADAATLAAVQHFNDSRIARVETHPQGLSSCLNHGINRAGGDWIALQTGSDIRPPYALSAMLAAGEGADLILAPSLAEGTPLPAEFQVAGVTLPESAVPDAGSRDPARAAGALAALPLEPAGMFARRKAGGGPVFPDGVDHGVVFAHLDAVARSPAIGYVASPLALSPTRRRSIADPLDALAILPLCLHELARSPRAQYASFRTGCVSRLIDLLEICETRLGWNERKLFRTATVAVISDAPAIWDELPEDGGGLCSADRMERFLTSRRLQAIS